MKFHSEKVGPEEVDVNVSNFQSENNVWAVRLDRVIFGCRVHVHKIGSNFFVTEYCAGDQPTWHVAVMLAVMRIMENYPETVTEHKLCGVFPRYKKRPMWNDPECWHQICETAGFSLDFEEAPFLRSTPLVKENIDQGYS